MSIKDFVNSKDKYMYYIMTVVCLFLLMVLFVCLMYASDATFQTRKDIFYYAGVTSFLIVLILIRKISFFNAPILATAAVYAIASVKSVITDYLAGKYGFEYRNALLAKYVAWGLFLIILVDVIRTEKKPCLKKEIKFIPYVILIAFSCALAMNLQYSLSVFCPFAALYLTPISKKQWMWLVDCLTTAYYGAFVCVMTKSLIIVPYEGKGINYYGIFTTAAHLGIFCAGAFVCVMYWFVKFWTAEKKNMMKVGLCVLAMVFPVYTTLIVYSRDAELGLLGCVLFVFVFVVPKRPDAWKKRGIGMLAIIAVTVLCGMLLLRFLVGVDAGSLKEAEGILGKRYLRWVKVAEVMYTSENTYFHSPVMSAIDMLLSIRPRILVEALKKVSFFGNNSMSVVVKGRDYPHPHNTYVSWLMMYGWLGGIPMIIWFFSFLVRSVSGVLKKDFKYLFPFLWGAFMVFAMLFETIVWMAPATFILLFVQYPLLVEQLEDGEEASLS
ncbi:MAG: hypothetical protein HDQ96_12135 [Lachnospiraceae bacterium]|nr:hypothetical protein [Lachnospiraceae bacterium]